MRHANFIHALESGEIEDPEEVYEGFQAMIDDGTVWCLQGSYARTAHHLIEQGYCSA